MFVIGHMEQTLPFSCDHASRIHWENLGWLIKMITSFVLQHKMILGVSKDRQCKDILCVLNLPGSTGPGFGNNLCCMFKIRLCSNRADLKEWLISSLYDDKVKILISYFGAWSHQKHAGCPSPGRTKSCCINQGFNSQSWTLCASFELTDLPTVSKTNCLHTYTISCIWSQLWSGFQNSDQIQDKILKFSMFKDALIAINCNCFHGDGYNYCEVKVFHNFCLRFAMNFES